MNDDADDIDPIIEELHRIRWKICKKVGGTPEAYARYYYEMSQARLAAEKSTPKARDARTTSKAATTARKPARRRKAVTA